MQTEYEQLSQIMSEMRQIAMKYEIVVITAKQAPRGACFRAPDTQPGPRIVIVDYLDIIPSR